jgi:hypothetical protein
MFSVNRHEDDTQDGTFDPDQFIDYNELDSDTMFKTTLLTPDPDSKSLVSNHIRLLPDTNTSVNTSLEMDHRPEQNATKSHLDVININQTSHL